MDYQLAVYCGNYHLDNSYFDTLEETKEVIRNYSLSELNDDLKEYAKENTLCFYVYDLSGDLIYKESREY